jgi:hypothetical protein
MYKKVVIGSFICLLVLIGVDLLSNLFVIDFTYYLLSLFILGLGIVVYPLDFKFRFKTDFMFLLVMGIIIVVNFVNLVFYANFSFNMYCINISVGIFGIVLSLLRETIGN